MKKFIAVIAFAVLTVASYANEVINLNRNWRFFSNIEKSSDAATIVNLPHTWNSDALMGKKDYFRGIGNYMRAIDVPEQWRGKRIYVKFYGAGTKASLFVDNRFVGQHIGGTTAFIFDITDFIKYGQTSFLWVTVNNSQSLDIMPTAGLSTVYGGLYRDVELIVAEPTHFMLTDNASDGVYINQKSITAERAEIEAKVKIKSYSHSPVAVEAFVVGAQGDTVLRATEKVKIYNRVGEVTIPMQIDNPHLWNGTLDPYLYTIKVKAYEQDSVSDELDLYVGLRTVSVDPQKGFMLNGKPYPVRGVAMQSDRSEVGVAVMNYQIREDLDLICDMGANFIKVCGMPQSRSFYSECDKRGLLVWSDIPFVGPAYMTDRGFVNTPEFKQNGINTLNEIIAQNFNYASIVMWGLFSDMTTSGDNPIDYITQLNSIAKAKDPSRITACSSNQDGDINFITSVVSWSHGFGWFNGQPEDMGVWLERFKGEWRGKLLSAVSYGAGGSIYHQSDTLIRPKVDGNWHPENWQSHVHEELFEYTKDSSGAVWGWFVNYMFDYGATGRSRGQDNGVDDMGLVSFDRKYIKDAYYFYKANWNKDVPFVYIANRRNDRRNNAQQNITVYSNSDVVELVVNGYSAGFADGVNGVFKFDNVTLKQGNNILEARITGAQDKTVVNIVQEYVLD